MSPVSGAHAVTESRVLLFVLLAALYCAWILSFPVFPNQDGPMHLYFVHVLSALQAKNHLFATYFAIRHPLPPYLVHYGLLIVLSRFGNAVLAEKLVVCLCILLFVFGFRSLVLAIDRRSGALAMFAIPLSLHWSLGMGFHNYCLALGLSLFGLSWWLQARATGKPWFRIAFLVAAPIMLFTHPVPLILLLAAAWSELIISAALLRISKREPVLLLWRKLQADIVTLLVASCSLVYIATFVHPGKNMFQRRGMLRDFFHLRPMLMIGNGLEVWLYQIFLFSLLAVLLGLGALQFLRHMRRGWLQSADLMFMAGAGFLLAFPFLPRTLNGADFFADRLVIYIWVLALASSAPIFAALSPGRRRVALLAACLVAIYLPVISDAKLRTASNQLAKLESESYQVSGRRGMMVSQPLPTETLGLTFDPYFWSPAIFFRRTDSVIMNAPWLDGPILPLQPKQGLFSDLIPGELLDRPWILSETLIDKPQQLQLLGRRLDLLLGLNWTSESKRRWSRFVSEPWPERWVCRPAAVYSLCESQAPPVPLGSSR